MWMGVLVSGVSDEFASDVSARSISCVSFLAEAKEIGKEKTS